MEDVGNQGTGFAHLTSLIYAAVVDQSMWEVFLQELSRRNGGVRTHLFGYDWLANITLGLSTAGYSPDFIESYSNYYANINAWAPAFAELQPGVAYPTHAMCPRDALMKTEFYADWVRPQEDVLAGGGALIFRDTTRMIALGGNIRRKDEEKLEDSWLRIVGILVPHIQHAFEVSRCLTGQTIELGALRSGQASGWAAVILLTDEGFLLHANAAAEEMITARTILRSDFGERISFCDDQAAGLLACGLSHLRHRTRPVASHFGVRGIAGKYVVRMVEYEPELHPVPPFALATSHWRASLLVTISPISQVVGADESIATEFGLTAAEIAIASSLVEGLTTREIADQRSVSINTVRNQIRLALSKTGMHRRLDLVRLIERSRRSLV